MKVIIVDDEIRFSQKLEKIVRLSLEDLKESLDIRQASNGRELLIELEAKQKFDIYLLDVKMPGMDGLALAKRIRFYDEDAHIIFITSYEQYALPSYKVGASDYVLKNTYREELPQALKKIRHQIEIERLRLAEDFYIISNEFRCRKVFLDELFYLTKEGKYVIFHCTDGGEDKERTTLETVLKRLPGTRFILINRGCIINMRYVSALERGDIRLCYQKNQISLPVSRYMDRAVRENLMEYWGHI